MVQASSAPMVVFMSGDGGWAALDKGLSAQLQQHGMPATPHAQRSRAVVQVDMTQAEFAPQPHELIDLIESTLGTAVQAAVKRVDEQAFARLNAEHLMFCEDAARLLKSALNQDKRFRDFNLMVEHQESLHAHNAVARARK